MRGCPLGCYPGCHFIATQDAHFLTAIWPIVCPFVAKSNSFSRKFTIRPPRSQPKRAVKYFPSRLCERCSLFPDRDLSGSHLQFTVIAVAFARRKVIAPPFRGCYETRLVVASVEQSRKNERRGRGLMIAQHAAAGGVLGRVGKTPE